MIVAAQPSIITTWKDSSGEGGGGGAVLGNGPEYDEDDFIKNFIAIH